MRRTLIGGGRIQRDSYEPSEPLYGLEHFNPSGNVIEMSGQYPDPASGPQTF
jgi:hypothetical protein